MSTPFRTRPERLAAERRAQFRATRAALVDVEGTLNPRFPYRVIPCDAAAFGARPLWQETVSGGQEAVSGGQ
jgi:hypothetical protein